MTRDLKEMEDEARKLGRTIKSVLPPNQGFFLALFDLGNGGNMTYMSNAERVSAIAMLRELITKLEKT